MAFPALQGTQHATTDAGSVSSAGLAFASTITSGNTCIVWVRQGATGGTCSVTDDKSNTYTQDATQAQTTDGHTLWLFRCSNITNGAKTVTVTFGAAATMRFAIYEYQSNWVISGTPPTAQGNSTTPSSGNQVTGVTTGIIGGISGDGIGSTFNAGAGWTTEDTFATARLNTEDRGAATQAAGTYAATGTYVGTAPQWTAIMAAYTDGGGGGPSAALVDMIGRGMIPVARL